MVLSSQLDHIGKILPCTVHINVDKKKIERVCEVCGDTYLTAPSRNYKYCSQTCYLTVMKGKNHPSYKGGVHTAKRPRNSYEGSAWRTKVFIKDDFTCQRCGEHGGKLNAHHILAYSQYPEHRLIVENGETLCGSCHKEFHILYGIKKFTDEDYWEWLKE